MRHTSVSAALLAAAVIGGLGISPSAAQAQTGPPAARTAWIKSCTGKNDATRPCGHWQLVLRDGRAIVLRDASATTTDRRGHKVAEPGALALSGDGRTVVYERARDHRLVARAVAGGPVRELPRSLVPKGYGIEDVSVYVSPSGDRVLVDCMDDADRVPSRVLTLATGKVVQIPGRDTPEGFSADGDEVLALRHPTDNTTAVVAYRLDGTSVVRTPPQVVANAADLALAADGQTVAVVASGDPDRKKPPRLRTYDLRTGELSGGVDLALKPDETPYHAQWGADGKLAAYVQTDEVGTTAVVRVLTVDTETGATTRTDRFTISKSRYAHVEAGE
ncbi:hypothetical protein ABT294_35780 [Nonomuraea sp. NPDC000554]|uniref:hypothetical protein n=1 Tax=Nonomuraea sp. NPDC000554 TaxID=3154259 RepID=UPI00332C843F